MEPVEQFEHAGVLVEIHHDDDGGNYGPQENDNAGTLYSWTRGWDGDEQITEPDLEVFDEELDDYREVDLSEFMRREYDAALTIPVYFADYGSSGARIYETDNDPNGALCFTQEEIEREWPLPTTPPEERPESMRDYVGGVEAARKYAEARLNELDMWMQGEVYGIVIRNPDDGEVMESVWGFIDDQVFTGDPEKSYTIAEARELAEGCAEQVAAEKAEAFRWACADVVTV